MHSLKERSRLVWPSDRVSATNVASRRIKTVLRNMGNAGCTIHTKSSNFKRRSHGAAAHPDTTATPVVDSLPTNLTTVGTSRCDVPAREAAGGIVAPLDAARTAQRAVPTRFRGSNARRFAWEKSLPSPPARCLRHGGSVKAALTVSRVAL